MAQQTAVEWLHDKLKLSLGEEIKDLNGLFVIAKEMEKEQRIKDYNDAVTLAMDKLEYLQQR